MKTTACVVGGGPAGMMLGWLLARQDVDVLVLEKHRDFFRDFRGDTIHPSTLDLLEELGVVDALLARPHTKIDQLEFDLLGERVRGPDLAHLPSRHRFIAMMPQWELLDFVREQASTLPAFHLEMGAEVTDLVHDHDDVTGVRLADGREITAKVVVGCDGRHSIVRAKAELPSVALGSPIDVLWFRIPRVPASDESVFAIVSASQFLVMLDRGDYWQCAYLIRKGAFEAIRARGLPAFHAQLRAIAPAIGDRVSSIRSWDDIKLLTVTVDRLTRWARPGLLCIGDAAHAMSPVGGVGINLAIQDAVATANLLGGSLARGTPMLAELATVQERREPATIKTQALQLQIHARLLAKVVAGHGQHTVELARWILKHVPLVRRYMARAIGVGLTPEHVTT